MVELLTPSINEQKAISNFLDQKTAEIDGLIADKEKLIELLQEKRQAIITEAVTKGLNPNVKMKDSGIEWIGEIPEHWNTSSLRWYVSIKSGDFISQEDIDVEGKIPVIGGNGLMSYTNKTNCNYKTIAIGRVGALCGNVHLIRRPSWITDNALFITNLSNKLYIEYLFYVLKALDLNQYANKTAQPLISGSLVKSRIIPIPPIVEQAAIADFLDQKTAEIDDLIADKEKLIELLQEKRQAVITEAVTKGLNPNVRLKDSGIEWIGEIPEHWSIIKMKYLLSSKKYSIKAGPFGSQLKNDDMVSGDIKVYNQKTVLDNDFKSGDYYIENCKYEELRAFEVFSGDLLVTTRGTIGKTAIVPKDAEKGILHPCLIKITLNPDKVLNDYVNVIFNNTKIVTNQIMLESNATTIDVIYTDTLKNLVLPIPPLEEQKSIIDFVDAKIGEIDGLISSINNQIQKLKEYRQSLISEAVTGKIDVRVFENKDEVIYSEQDSSPCRELTHVAE